MSVSSENSHNITCWCLFSEPMGLLGLAIPKMWVYLAGNVVTQYPFIINEDKMKKKFNIEQIYHLLCSAYKKELL